MLPALNSVADVNEALPANVRVTAPLAHGGQGMVFRGTADGIEAAVKLYLPGQIEVRVEREIDALVRLNCPTIARLLWSGEIAVGKEVVQVVATSLINGTTLADLLKQRPLTDNEIGAIVYDVAEAVQHIWSIRLVHRDLKPSNIIISGGRATVIDLGIARHVNQSSLTATGATWGTLGYMSPEQTRGVKQLTCKSDLFALGIIAVEGRIQRHPTNGDQLRLVAGRLHEALPGHAEKLPMAALIRHLLAPRATGRPSPEQVLAELNDYRR